jgi:(S)-2-hydroxyglutarate dehydrogenase
MSGSRFDLVVIGGGIIGLATALEVTRRFPRLKLIVLEKEDGVARHQSGHNSGVIHSGIYYKPGSLKARLCVEGARAMVEFCGRHGIPHEVCGKVIVATRQDEIPRLEELRRRGEANGILGLRLLDAKQLHEFEPHCRGVLALHVPVTGITDYAQICEKYSELMQQQGGDIRFHSRVTGFERNGPETVVETRSEDYSTRFVINCAGLFADRISQLAGAHIDGRVIPFRGEYYDLIPSRQHLVRNLIYPVTDPRFPFLGVHFTRRVSGTVDAGPNAVLAFRREGYRKTDFSARDFAGTVVYPGFWRMASRYWRNGVAELRRSWSKRVFVEALQRLLPDVTEADLVPSGSGVRAQVLRADGSLVDDFLFVPDQNMLHVVNVPSPAATASLPISRTIVDMAAANFGLTS